MYKELCESLLAEWCDRMLALQITDENEPGLYGGILCPACARVHGRCMDALYPFLYRADQTKDPKWIEAAKRLFEWTENSVSRPDGSYANGTNNPWFGITVFTVVQLCEALKYHGHLLDTETIDKWKKRIHKAADFLMEFAPIYHHNVNYRLTNALAMQLCGELFNESRYIECGRRCAHQLKEYLSLNNLLFGEGIPTEGCTARGCRSVDIGYNVEESLPSLALYAELTKDKELQQYVKKAMEAQLQFMLPDGAWDNSFGTRSYKWTYWGSRTSDGCALGYALMAKENPAFITAVHRNLELLKHCTHDGLLEGGLHYHIVGERACVHHTFTHAKVLAGILDHELELEGQESSLPREKMEPYVYFPEVDVVLLRANKLLATNTCFDWEYVKGGQASGGNMTLLWHPSAGPILCATMSEYKMVEPNNQQLPRFEHHECLSPRLEWKKDKAIYSTLYDFKAKRLEHDERTIVIKGEGVTIDHVAPVEPLEHQSTYCLKESGLEVKIELGKDEGTFVCPLISSKEEVIEIEPKKVTIKKAGAIVTLHVRKGTLHLPYETERCYNLVAGLQALKTEITPENKEIWFNIEIEEK